MYSVLFDIDGTLVDTGGAGRNAFAAAFAELFDIAEISRDVRFAGRSDRAIALELMEVHGVEPSAEHWRQFVESYLGHLETTLPLCQGRILPGVVGLLDQLQTIEHALPGLLTGNVRAGAARKLTQYGLADRFKFGGFGDIWNDRNAIAKEAAEQARFHARGVLNGTMVIGDTVCDVTCARSIGAFAVAVATGGSTREELLAAGPDLLLDDLSDTETLLAEVGI
ncbi:MAG: HAD hydrolase-like protein [Planctomycetales bacterium]|nr:HAD hydrolase-like protein [Planctomycetales bacterium]